MKISTKILLLAIAICLVVSTVMFFYMRVASPPKYDDSVDRYALDIINDTEVIEDTKDLSKLDSMLLVGLVEYDYWYRAQLVDSVVLDQTMDDYIVTFTDRYNELGDKLLKNDTWNGDQIDNIYKTAYSLLNFNLMGNEQAPATRKSSSADRLNRFVNTCNRYVRARSLISDRGYSNFDSVYAHIKYIKECAGDDYIKHSDIKSGIDSFPGNKGDSHYAYIKRLYDNVGNWKNRPLSSTLADSKKLADEAKKYSGTKMYGSPHPYDTDEMVKNAAAKAKTAADEKCSLSVDGHSSDFSVSLSPSDGTVTLSVSTDHPDGFKVENGAGFCSVKSSKNSVTIRLTDTSTSDQSGYVTVKAGKKSVRVNVVKRSNEPSVSITSVDMTHNVQYNGQTCMRINVHYIYSNCSSINFVAWFYTQGGSALKDKNGVNCTTDGQVSTSTWASPSASQGGGTAYLYMPLNELHLGTGKHELKFYVGAFVNNKNVTNSSYQFFTYTLN